MRQYAVAPNPWGTGHVPQPVTPLLQMAVHGGGQMQRQKHITLVERLKSHTATSEALVMSQAKLA